MKVLADWDELYPALFLRIEGDGHLDKDDRKLVARYGRDVPNELAARWRKARDDWQAVDAEVRAHFGVDP
jgi:hypothetical protein